MTENILQKYNKWIKSKFITKYEKNKLEELNKEEIRDSFFKYLEFGTGGMKGIRQESAIQSMLCLKTRKCLL